MGHNYELELLELHVTKFIKFFLKFNLESLTIIYLGIPILIFLAAWLKIWIAIIFVILFLTAFFLSIKKSLNKKFDIEDFKKKINWGLVFNLLLVLVVLVGWFGFSGIGNMNHQNADYEKHNAMLYDLITKSWPVFYSTNSGNQPLVYYFAFYLPSALIGKVFGLNIAIQMSAIWAFAGLLIAIFWFFKLTNTRSVLSLYVFIFFGGLDLIGKAFVIKQNPFDLEIAAIWPGGLQFSGSTIALYWVPQHALVAWLAISLIYSKLVKKDYGSIIFFLSLTILWSPFVFIGLLPFCLILLKPQIIKRLFTLENIFGGLISIVCLLFLYTPGKDLMSGWIWKFYSPLALFNILIAFYVLSTLIWFALLDKRSIFENIDNKIILIIFLVLILFPLYWFGFNDDFAMRATLPAQFLLCIFITRTLFLDNNFDKSKEKKKFYFFELRKLLILICLFIATFSGLTEITRSVTYPDEKYEYKSVTKLSGSNDLLLYLGKNDSLFFRFLGK